MEIKITELRLINADGDFLHFAKEDNDDVVIMKIGGEEWWLYKKEIPEFCEKLTEIGNQ